MSLIWYAFIFEPYIPILYTNSLTMDRSKIQVLYDACGAIFSQEEPTSYKQIQYLKNLLGGLRCSLLNWIKCFSFVWVDIYL